MTEVEHRPDWKRPGYSLPRGPFFLWIGSNGVGFLRLVLLDLLAPLQEAPLALLDLFSDEMGVPIENSIAVARFALAMLRV